MRLLRLIAILLLLISPATHLPESSASQQRTDPAAEPLKLTTSVITALVNECGQRTTRMTWRLYDYTYTETDTDSELDKSGQVIRERSKVYEVNPVFIGKKSYWVRVQIAEDGVALSNEKVSRERERVVKELTQAEESVAREEKQAKPAGPYKQRFSSYGIRVEKRSGMSRTIWYINPTDFLRSHEFYEPRRLVLNNRETILLSFRPRPDYVFDKTNVPFSQGIEDYGRVMSQLGGKLWIDMTDKVIARLEAMPVGEMDETGVAAKNSTSVNAPLRFEFTRLPNGTWVPSRSWYNSYGREKVFWKTAISREQMYSGFKLFKTSVEVEKLEPSPEKPR